MNLFHFNLASDWLSRKLLASSTFIEPVAKFLRLKKDTILKEKTFCTALMIKYVMNTIKTYIDVEGLQQARPDSRSDEQPVRMTPKRCSTRLKSECDIQRAEHLSISSKYFEDNNYYLLKLESGYQDCLML